MAKHPTAYYLRQLIGCKITDVQKWNGPPVQGMANHDLHVFSFTDAEGIARELLIDADCYSSLDIMFRVKEPSNG